jgi:hypothetical protein
MSPIVPYENDDPYRSASLQESLAFWGYICKKRPASIILYVSSFVIFFLIIGQLARELSGGRFGGPFALISALVILPMLFFYFPKMPALYKFQFKGKIRPDIKEEELTRLINEMIVRSLELASISIIAIGILCALVYSAAKYLALSDMVTLVLLAATVFNVFLVSLVAFSLGGYNKEFLRRTFTDEEYMRFSSPGSYKRIYAALAIFDAIIVLVLLYMAMNTLTIGLTMILLGAIVVNIFLALASWNYIAIRNKGERKALVLQEKMTLAFFIIIDLILIASLVIQQYWSGHSYETTAFTMLTIFFLASGALSILWFLFTSARRMLRKNLF